MHRRRPRRCVHSLLRLQDAVRSRNGLRIYLGPANKYLIDALPPEMGPVNARGAQLGYSKSATSNTTWPHLGCNAKGRGRFGAIRRCGSLMWNDHIAFAAPCLVAPKRPPAHRLHNVLTGPSSLLKRHCAIRLRRHVLAHSSPICLNCGSDITFASLT